jgi:cbb3-type cytochrome oxidase subunit 3
MIALIAIELIYRKNYKSSSEKHFYIVKELCMSWENDPEIIVVLGVLVLFIIFCAIMAVRSSKKKNGEMQYSAGIRLNEVGKKDSGNSVAGFGFLIFIGVVWLLSAVLIFILYNNNSLSGGFQIPRILALPYDMLGVTAGAVVQVVLSLAIIIASIRGIIKKKKSNSGYTLN